MVAHAHTIKLSTYFLGLTITFTIAMHFFSTFLNYVGAYVSYTRFVVQFQMTRRTPHHGWITLIRLNQISYLC
jgi:hypothetical protein